MSFLAEDLHVGQSRFPLLFIAFRKGMVQPPAATYSELSEQQAQKLRRDCREWFEQQPAKRRQELESEYFEYLSTVSP